MTTPFALVNMRDGVRRDVEPFLLDNDGFPFLENCYLFRGRIERKSALKAVGIDGRLKSQFIQVSPFAGLPNALAGSTTYTGTLANLPIIPGSLTISIATPIPTTFIDLGDGRLAETTAPITITNISQANPAVVTLPGEYFNNTDQVYITGVNGMFEVNNLTFPVAGSAAPFFDIGVDSTIFAPYISGGVAQRVSVLGIPNVINYDTGVFTINFNALPAGGPYIVTATYTVAPCMPVMGLRTKESQLINDEFLIAFDLTLSYLFDTGLNDFRNTTFYKESGLPFTWTGTDSDFFWSYNWRNAMWTTNNIPGFKWALVTISNAAPAQVTLAGHTFVAGDDIYLSNFSAPPAAGFFNPDLINPFNSDYNFIVQAPVVAGVSFFINNPAPPGAVLTAWAFIPNTNDFGTGDGIRWYDGPNPANPATGWMNFGPPLSKDVIDQRYLYGGLLIVTYKDRLLVLNTVEGDVLGNTVRFNQRARYSQNGTPFYTGTNVPPANQLPENQESQYDAWFDDRPGKGGFVDAPTNEQIVSCEFIKDTLVVYFERSSWQLVYTGNELLPFVWQKINTELGSESTFSIVPFDRGVFGIGNYGIISCDSVNVERIDQKIPDEVFDFRNLDNGVKRVHGIRDYSYQLVYWTFPWAPLDKKFPNRVLLFNYLDGSWANFQDSFTCFGYFQANTDLTWAKANFTWDSTSFTWTSNARFAKYPLVIAGNQQGFVMICNQSLNEYQSDPTLCLTAMTTGMNVTITSANHNLEPGQFIQLVNPVGITGPVSNPGAPTAIYSVISTTTNTFVIDNGIKFIFGGAYTGGGTIRVCPNLTIRTKLFNPYYEQGVGMRLPRLEVMAERTDFGQVTVSYLTSFTTTLAVNANLMNTSADNPSPAPLNPIYQNLEEKIWHRMYPNCSGSFIQVQIDMNDTFDVSTQTWPNSQMRNPNQTFSEVTIHGLVVYAQPTGRLIQ